MPEAPPLKGSDYYESLPISDHRAGDIWRGLPGFDIFGSTVSGIIITPACDLAARKCESITYLPLISIDSYLSSSDFRVECWKEILSVISKLKAAACIGKPSRFELPSYDELIAALDAQVELGGKPLSDSDEAKFLAYTSYVNRSMNGTATGGCVRKFFKEERFEEIAGKIITNAFKGDLHFLPKDGQDAEISAVPTSSVVLFRYPFSVPIATLDLASRTSPTQWKEVCSNQVHVLPTLKHFYEWPVKLATLKNRFFGDLLSRYTSMYIRLGSPDFSEDSVRHMATEIGNA